MEIKLKQSKLGILGRFIKRNIYYILAGVCVLAIAGIITVSNLNAADNSVPVDKPLENTPSAPVVETVNYVLPLAEFTILKDYLKFPEAQAMRLRQLIV